MIDVKFIHGDCLEVMPTLPDKSIDIILCDLPYGTTACKWDTIIPFEPLWTQYKRLIKGNGAIVLTASQPFTSALVMSNPGWFKYELIWEKDKPSDFALANIRPMKYHENIIVFAKNKTIYNKQLTRREGGGLERCKYKIDQSNQKSDHVTLPQATKLYDANFKNPKSIIKVSTGCRNNSIHHTQKPVALFEYLIRTYTNEGDTVLDNCSGSGTTGIAAFNTNRNAILIEKDETYFNAARERFDRETRQVAMW